MEMAGLLRNPKFGYGVALSLLVFLAFSPVLDNDFINYDDPPYVTANPNVLGGLTAGNIRWAFSAVHSHNWHPLTWISHMVDVQMYGLNPTGHHVTSLMLHISNSVLLFALLFRMTGGLGRSACVAALFALHPLHVESVAWVSERKDVLSTLFMLLALLAYREYTRSAKKAAYALCALLYIAGLMAKGMLVSFPIVLLLVDYWPLNRLRQASSDSASTDSTSPVGKLLRLVLEKIPLLVLSVASAVIVYLAQSRSGAVSADGSPIANAGNAIWSYVAYIHKAVWPLGLSVYYPFAPVPLWKCAIALVVIVAVSVAAIRFSVRFPWLAVGWFWYLITLFPVAGFVKIGQHAMADRYTYIPLIGLFVVVVWGSAELAGRFRVPRAALAGAAIGVLAICSVLTYRQAQRWHGSVTLFRYALEVTENNSMAHKNLGAALASQGKYGEALQHVTESLRIQPEPKGYVTQAWLYLQIGEYGKALRACRNSIALSPGEEKAHFLSGVSYQHLGDHRSAIQEYQVLLSLGSPYAERLYEYLRNSGIVVPFVRRQKEWQFSGPDLRYGFPRPVPAADG
jgi:hypothetical protein